MNRRLSFYGFPGSGISSDWAPSRFANRFQLKKKVNQIYTECFYLVKSYVFHKVKKTNYKMILKMSRHIQKFNDKMFCPVINIDGVTVVLTLEVHAYLQLFCKIQV